MNIYKRKEVIGDCTLYLGDCLDVLPTLGKVDAVVTSPPYDNLRDYGDDTTIFNWEDYITPISDSIIDGGAIMWNVADSTTNGSESGSSFKQCLSFMEGGLNLHDTMIYHKPQASMPDSRRYFNAFEYMFIFSKGKLKTFNPIMDRKNKYAGTSIHGTRREKDGTTSAKTNTGKIISDYGMRFNVWMISHDQTCTEHPATMPYSMSFDHIESWSNPYETILDPFMGSGTTGVACTKLGRKFIGIELEEKYFDIACKRIEEAYNQPDLFIEPPIEHTQGT